MDTVVGWYDTHETAEAAAREYEDQYPQASVEVVRDDGKVVPRLD